MRQNLESLQVYLSSSFFSRVVIDLVKCFEGRTDRHRSGRVWVYYSVHRAQYSSNLGDPFAFVLFLLKTNTILQNLPHPVNYGTERETTPLRYSQHRKMGH